MSLNDKRPLSLNLSDSEDEADFPHKRKKSLLSTELSSYQTAQKNELKSELLNAGDSLLNTFSKQQSSYAKSEYVATSKTNFAAKLMVISYYEAFKKSVINYY